jgi:hypothetical protein
MLLPATRASLQRLHNRARAEQQLLQPSAAQHGLKRLHTPSAAAAAAAAEAAAAAASAALT